MEKKTGKNTQAQVHQNQHNEVTVLYCTMKVRGLSVFLHDASAPHMLGVGCRLTTALADW